jgi:hypothetical protein
VNILLGDCSTSTLTMNDTDADVLELVLLLNMRISGESAGDYAKHIRTTRERNSYRDYSIQDPQELWKPSPH